MTVDTVYRTSPLKRHRRTKAELVEINEAIIEIAEAEQPITVRGLFYRVGESVEVDAISSSTLRDLVREAIEMWIDPEALRLTRIAEESERDILLRIADDAA